MKSFKILIFIYLLLLFLFGCKSEEIIFQENSDIFHKSSSFTPLFYGILEDQARIIERSSLFNVPKILTSNLSLSEIEDNLCLASIVNLAQNMSEPAFQNIIFMSGLGLNELGNYGDCMSSSVSNYMVLSWEIQSATFQIGLCLPKVCNADYVKPALPSIATAFSYFSGINIPSSQFTIYDVERFNSSYQSYSWGTYATIIVFGIVVLLILIGTLVENYPKHLGRNESIDEKEIEIINNQKRSGCAEFWKCFSITKNFQDLFNQKNKIDENLDALHGVRVLSMAWIVFGHAFYFMAMMAIYNLQEMSNSIFKTYSMAILTNADLSVDTFFFLAGFVSTILIYKNLSQAKNRTVKKVIMLYVHRYIRLFPIYGASILFSIYILPHLAIGPLAYKTEGLVNNCKGQWFLNLLYVDNFYATGLDSCMGWTWYLNLDFQFFIFVPFIVLLYIKNYLYGLFAVGGLSIISIIVQCILISVYGLNPAINKPSRRDSIYFDKPYCRINTYLIGILLSFIYISFSEPSSRHPASFEKIIEKIRNSRLIRWILYLVGFGICYISVFSMFFLTDANSISTFVSVIYFVFDRPLFIFGLSLFLLPILLNRGKIFQHFLGYGLFGFLSRFTYGAYMIHCFFYIIFYVSEQNGKFYKFGTLCYYSVGVFFISYTVSVIVSLFIESPVVMLEKKYLFRRIPQPLPSASVVDGENEELIINKEEIREEPSYQDKRALNDTDSDDE